MKVFSLIILTFGAWTGWENVPLRNCVAHLEIIPLVGGGSLLSINSLNLLAHVACSACWLSVFLRPEATLGQGHVGSHCRVRGCPQVTLGMGWRDIDGLPVGSANPILFSLGLSFFLCKSPRSSLSLECNLKHMLSPGEGQRARLEWKSPRLYVFSGGRVECVSLALHYIFPPSHWGTRVEERRRKATEL